jgi:Major Facilitator Superfamily
METVQQGNGTFVFALTAAIGALGLAAGGTAGALLARQLAGAGAAGLPLGALVLGSGVAALALSAFSRRHSRVVGLAAGFLAGGVGAVVVVAAASAGSLFGVLVGSALMGAANAAVLLTRYAAAELTDVALRGRALGIVFVATSVGATASPLLLQPSGALAQSLGLPLLSGAYVTAGAVFTTAAVVLVALAPKPAPASPTRSRPLVAGLAAPFVTLAAANFVMVAVMTVAPICLLGGDAGLTMVGAGIALHVACMFAPAPLSGRLADRCGPIAAVRIGFAYLGAAGLSAVTLSGGFLGAMLVLIPLGIGWNFCVIGGSVEIAAAAWPAATRTQIEGAGEAAMAAAAVVAAPLAGVVVDGAGFRWLAVVCLSVVLAGLVATTMPATRVALGRADRAPTHSP